MHFVYIDDSTERPRHIFSALCIPTENWNAVFAEIKAWRQFLRSNDDIPLRYELHARKFISGRGTGGTLRTITRHRRAQIFTGAFRLCASFQQYGVCSLNACFGNDNQDMAFENLLNRINRTMVRLGSFAHLICDEGKEAHYTKIVRRMRVHNPIPSNRGLWEDGSLTRNITLERIIEDPQFKSSDRSYLIQMADFIAFGLLRREAPTPRIKRYGIHKAFDQLLPILVTQANRRDDFGVIRE